eukprot:TRINITY_DN10383_c0_g1_i1.p1 TRINITY_DN10383_c0_g1~~TRINITY_DN10383_c0_g1_i1.p1  ORF type:complete len:208 (-),score=20.33 TRINITY_DN10383_c0_g1_i1:50-673(-)
MEEQTFKNSKRQMLIGIYIQIVLGIYLLGNASYRVLSHDYSILDDFGHDHHLCDFYAVALSVLVVWYFLYVCLIGISTAKYSNWGLRLVSYPTVILMFCGIFMAFYLVLSLNNHDDVTYSAVLESGDGILVLTIALFNYVFVTIPLQDRETYIRQFLRAGVLGFFSFAVVMYFFGTYPITYLAYASGGMFIFGYNNLPTYIGKLMMD